MTLHECYYHLYITKSVILAVEGEKMDNFNPLLSMEENIRRKANIYAVKETVNLWRSMQTWLHKKKFKV